MYDPTKPYKHDISKLIGSTWKTPYLSVKPGIYTLFKNKNRYFEVDHTDGIGTKAEYHWKNRTFSWAVQDVIAMNLNDLAMVKAKAFKLQNHIILPKDDHKAIISIVRALSLECRKRRIAITGGETSVHLSQNVFDISMCVSGFVKKPKNNKILPGDVLIGIKSNGLHSNGFTKVTSVFKKDLPKDYLKPTQIYADEVLKVCDKVSVNGMMHITGGAFTKLKDIAHDVNVLIDQVYMLKPQKVFLDIFKKGVSDYEMYRTFNCGVGFVLSVNSRDVDKVLKMIKGSAVIGKTTKGEGEIKIRSAFSSKEITY